MRQCDWIAVDWGTTHLRAWAMAVDGSVLAEARSDQGMGRLTQDGFEPALLDLISPWLGDGAMPILACGMVGARQGWQEAPYAELPCDVAALRPMRVRAKDARLQLRIVAGLCQRDPADVMRGEETQIAGFLGSRAGFDGVLCLPGTHSKWVRVQAGQVVAFRTAMTGELFGLLAGQSVLRLSLGDGWDARAFQDAVAQALAQPEKLLAALFSIRAGALLHGADPAAARSRLSGLLLGMELAGLRAFWDGGPVHIIGAASLAENYRLALAVAGVSGLVQNGDEMTLAGLAAIYRAQGAQWI